MDNVIIPDDIADVKRGIDHIGVTVAAIVHDGNGQILLMKRGQRARDEQGKWDICGGAVEFGETIESALIRELNEELCSVPLSASFLSVFEAHREYLGTPTHWVGVLYGVQVDPSKVKNGEPHKIDDIGWFGLDTLPSPLHSQFPKALREAKKHGIIL